MPIAIVLTLTAPTDVTLMHHPATGRINYANTLAFIRSVDNDVGSAIHDADGPTPLTCSGLWPVHTDRDGVHVRAGQEVHLRITGLTPAVESVLEKLLCTETRPTHWPMQEHPFALINAVCDSAVDGWSGQVSYEALAAQQLLQPGQPNRRTTFSFHSPVSFKSNNMYVPIPMPDLLFGSLVERWNAFSPVTLSPEMRRFGAEMVALSNYQLRSQPVIQKSGAPIVGSVGKATYIALGGDRYWHAVMQMLADFAFYSGVGIKTTTGMGQLRRADNQ